MERLVDRRAMPLTGLEYMVKWKGWGEEENTWESMIVLNENEQQSKIRSFEDALKKGKLEAVESPEKRHPDQNRDEYIDRESPPVVPLPQRVFKQKVVKSPPEETVTCPYCRQVYHNTCVMYHPKIYGDLPCKCPNPACQKRWEAHPALPGRRELLDFRMADVPTSPMTNFIENYIKEKVWGKEEKCSKGAKGASAKRKRGPSADKLRVRMVSNVKRTMEMTPVMIERYGVNGPFPYMARTMLVTTEAENDKDIIFLGLVVNEFGPECPEPNKNKVYLAYVDSVQLYHQSSCCMYQQGAGGHTLCSDPEGCNDERKKIVRALLMGYLDSARRRGYKSAYIWSMPPNDGNHEYMFHMRPTHQHIPTAHQLESWYQRLLAASQTAGILTNFESNCNDDRRLPDSLFTRKGERSLRFAPQFPGTV